MTNTTLANQDSSSTGEQNRRPIIPTHPNFRDNVDDWTIIADCLDGERSIKNKKAVY